MRHFNTHKRKNVSVQERAEAEIKVLYAIQRSQFQDEITCISSKGRVKSSKLVALNPYLDENGILRVGDRLRNASVSISQKHTILLPSYHHVTDLIIKEPRERAFHAGTQSTVHSVTVECFTPLIN